MDTQVTNETIATLLGTPSTITARTTALAGLRADLTAAREELAQARADYDAALGAATMEAYASGTITGKNQSERDAQLDAWLRAAASVVEAKAMRTQREMRVTRQELAVETTESEVKALVYTLQAAQYAATLQAAVINYEQTELASRYGEKIEQREELRKKLERRQAQRDAAPYMPDRVKTGPDGDLYK